mmetsp:Transcript_24193/g.68507  ORF Transcript_24193/g.68507 Transcript_24193/m.68507 type:complete len:214 (-) Transcript_24193:507-1148(-)
MLRKPETETPSGLRPAKALAMDREDGVLDDEAAAAVPEGGPPRPVGVGSVGVGLERAAAAAILARCSSVRTDWVCRRVLMTSSGVVAAAATAPARPPETKKAGRLYSLEGLSTFLKDSLAATMMPAKGMFMASVVGRLRKKAPAPSACETERAQSKMPAWRPSWRRCLMTSMGVMMASWPSVATAPQAAAAKGVWLFSSSAPKLIFDCSNTEK